MKDFMGLAGYVWWQGVVEDRDDPLKLGRCRVRILGFHTEDKEKIPTDSLPWAYPAMPLTAMPGSIPAAMVEGTWVMGFFRDGEDAQEPVITHKIDNGMVTENDKKKGFNDPETNKDRPKNENKPSKVGESNISTLVLGDRGKSDAPKIKREYPYNYVIETESGHVIELNDTPKGESVSVTHKTGSYVIIDEKGNFESNVKEFKNKTTKSSSVSIGTILEAGVGKVEDIGTVVLKGNNLVVDNLTVTGGVVANDVVGLTSVTGSVLTGVPSPTPSPTVADALEGSVDTVKGSVETLVENGLEIPNILMGKNKEVVSLAEFANKAKETISQISMPDSPILSFISADVAGTPTELRNGWVGREDEKSYLNPNQTYLVMEYVDSSRGQPIKVRLTILEVTLNGSVPEIDFEHQPTYQDKRIMFSNS
tara:strand:+ start:586 stop:1854 length:1269 start_codon:yes stop_codon:yes gene_type:complete